MHFNFSDPSTISKQIVYGLINKKDEFVEDYLIKVTSDITDIMDFFVISIFIKPDCIFYF